MITVGSLFSGIGGIDLGLQRAGMQIKWQVENDPYCIKVLEKHWPEVYRREDIRTVNGTELPPVNLVCGGFPCQPVSNAGKRKGEDDERWLWPEFHRIIREVGPEWVLVENVPGLLSINSGRVFGGILRDLAQSGYDAEWDCIPAAAVGAPHRRDRVFIVAHSNGTWEASGGGDRGMGGFSQSFQNLAHPKKQLWNDLQTHRIRGYEGMEEEREPGRHHSEAIPQGGAWELCEPPFCGGDDGVSNRVDRLRGLGNAVVPQVIELIGRQIIKSTIKTIDQLEREVYNNP